MIQSRDLLVLFSVGQRLCRHHEQLLTAGVSALSQPPVIVSTLPLLLSIHLELVIVLDYSQQLKQPSKLLKLTKVTSHSNNVCAVIIVHVISVDAQIQIQTWKTQSKLGTSGQRTLLGWLVINMTYAMMVCASYTTQYGDPNRRLLGNEVLIEWKLLALWSSPCLLPMKKYTLSLLTRQHLSAWVQ